VGGMYESFFTAWAWLQGQGRNGACIHPVWSGKGIATFTATGDRPIQKKRAYAV